MLFYPQIPVSTCLLCHCYFNHEQIRKGDKHGTSSQQMLEDPDMLV